MPPILEAFRSVCKAGRGKGSRVFRATIDHSMVKKVILVSPRGFCAGVVRAIDIVKLALQAYPKPVYVRKEIVHNPYVVEELRRKGAVFVESLLEVPAGQTVIFSAHGVAPEVWAEAQTRKLRVIDATCPLVTKVHLEAVRYARQEYTIILIGHKGHDEVIGTMGEAPSHMRLVSSVQEVEDLRVPDPQKVSYLTQTTLSLEDTRAIVEALRRRYPAIQGPPSEDICYATQNRQMAVRELARQADLILVVGAANSSNSNRLVEEAVKAGCRAFLINDVGSVEPDWLEGVDTVGVTSGASAPEILVTQVLDYFQAQGATVEELSVREEHVQFALPVTLLNDLRKAGNP
jgi:4-hydroxy-3-methylbut-2-en-1-yl diphosphate reductase